MNEHTNILLFNGRTKNITDKGGTMRLGAWKCDLKADSLTQNLRAINKFERVTVT
jgi:CTP synthase